MVSFCGYHYAFRLHNAIPAYPCGKFNLALMELSVHFFLFIRLRNYNRNLFQAKISVKYFYLKSSSLLLGRSSISHLKRLSFRLGMSACSIGVSF